MSVAQTGSGGREAAEHAQRESDAGRPSTAAIAQRRDERHPPGSHRSVFLPLVLFLAAWLLWSGFQSMQLLRDREALQQLHANQEVTVQNALQMRRQLDALAAGTKTLADSGNPHAAQLVAELGRRGISINP